MESQKEMYIIKLKQLHGQMQSIIDLFGERTYLVGESKTQAQEMLIKIKEKLREDYKLSSNSRRPLKMTPAEKACYFPAIEEVLANMTIKTNSIPNQKWLYDLFDAQSTIDHYLRELENFPN